MYVDFWLFLLVYTLLSCAIYTHFEFRIILLQRKRQKERGLLDKIINYPSIMRLILWLTILCTLILPLVSSTKPSAFDLYKKNHNKGNLFLMNNFFLQKVKDCKLWHIAKIELFFILHSLSSDQACTEQHLQTWQRRTNTWKSFRTRRQDQRAQ